MKKLTFILFFVITISGYCQKEKYDLSEIPNKANKIIITNSSTAEENYMFVGKILVQNGYGLKIANKDFGQFETEPRPMNRKQGWKAIFNIAIADSSISVTGLFTQGISVSFSANVKNEAAYYKIQKLAKGIFDNTGIYEMTDFALKFGTDIKYVIQ